VNGGSSVGAGEHEALYKENHNVVAMERGAGLVFLATYFQQLDIVVSNYYCSSAYTFDKGAYT